MIVRNKIVIFLLIASVVTNIFQWLITSGIYVIGAKVEFTEKLPNFNDREKKIINKAAPALLDYSAILQNSYIGKIIETNDNISIHLYSHSLLRDHKLSVPGYYTGYTRNTYDGVPKIFHFDQHMSLKRIDNWCAKSIYFKDGIIDDDN